MDDVGHWYSVAASKARAGDFEGVVAACRKLVDLAPGDARAHFNLASALHRLGRAEAAESGYRQCIALDAGYAPAYFNLAQLVAPDRADEAIRYLETGLRLQPGNAQGKQLLASVLFSRGNAWLLQDRYGEAIDCYSRALVLVPGQAAILNSMGVAHLRNGQPERGREVLERAIEYDPSFAQAYTNMGSVYEELGQRHAAIQAHQKALSLDDRLFEAHYNLANLLVGENRFAEAIGRYRKALALQPDNSEAHNNLGNAFVLCGEVPRAIDSYRSAVRCDAGNHMADSNLLFTMMCDSGYSAREIYSEHLRWASAHAASLAPPRDSGQKGEHAPRLRIAYLSPDFRKHSVASFIEPVLRCHDRSRLDVYCYSNVKREDAVTRRLRGLCQNWRNIHGVDDETAAGMIRQDGIDILVDLAGHSAGNRLLLLARKPAPVQVTWLGYPNTTGLDTVDYRITDSVADPHGMADEIHSETLVRMPRVFICYQPLPDPPEISQPPCMEKGYVTFGSFNNLAKVNDEVVAIWAAILRKVQGARLLIKHLAFGDTDVRAAFVNRFRQHGIDPDRLELTGWVDSPCGHLGAYSRVDIALDTFPYNGTTTSCEALSMGVPVVALAGEAHVARVGVSLLTSVGLDEMIAEDEKEYVEIAAALARDRSRLCGIRSGLRQRLLNSPLCDAQGFVRELENLYFDISPRPCPDTGHG